MLSYSTTEIDGWYSALRPSHCLSKPHTKAFIKYGTKTLNRVLGLLVSQCFLLFFFFFSVPCSNSCVKSNFIFYLLYRRLNFQIILQEKRLQTVTVPGCLSSSALRDAHAKNSRCYLELPCDNSLSETLPLWTQRQCKVDCCSTGLPPYFQGHPREIQLKHMLPFEFNGWGEVEGRLACMSSLPGCCCSFIY